MNKRKGMILTLALLLAAGAAVVGSRMLKNSKHNEVNTETENASEQIATETELAAGKNSSEEVQPDIQDSDFYISEIPDDIFAKMQGKSYKEDCTVPREDLRYVHVRHMGFDGEVKDGE